MKELITTILIIWGLLYFAISFINAELNAFKWIESDRVVYIVLSFFATLVIVFVYNLNR